MKSKIKKILCLTLALVLLIPGFKNPNIEVNADYNYVGISVNRGNDLDAYTKYDVIGFYSNTNGLNKLYFALYSQKEKKVIRMKSYDISSYNIISLDFRKFEEFKRDIKFEELEAGQYTLYVGATAKEVSGVANHTYLSSTNFNVKYNSRSFVLNLYKKVLNREPDLGGFSSWVNGLNSGRIGAANVIRGFYNSQEYINKERNNPTSNSDYVKNLYRSVLNREYDQGGYENWMNHLNNGRSRQFVLDCFLNSPEFSNVCKQFNIYK